MIRGTDNRLCERCYGAGEIEYYTPLLALAMRTCPRCRGSRIEPYHAATDGTPDLPGSYIPVTAPGENPVSISVRYAPK